MFYWHRREHIDDLRALMDAQGINAMPVLLARIKGVAKGKALRRLTEINDLIDPERGGAHD